MRISKSFDDSEASPGAALGKDECEADAEDDDEELLMLKSTTPSVRWRIMYDIIHSSSYQVPVVYLTVKSPSTGYQASVDDLYRVLVPSSYKSQMSSVGVMGALSMTEHPVTGTPALYVHPCRTQEAMMLLAERRKLEPKAYIMLWLGTVGAGIGLNVPVRLAQELARGNVGIGPSSGTQSL